MTETKKNEKKLSVISLRLTSNQMMLNFSLFRKNVVLWTGYYFIVPKRNNFCELKNCVTVNKDG